MEREREAGDIIVVVFPEFQFQVPEEGGKRVNFTGAPFTSL